MKTISIDGPWTLSFGPQDASAPQGPGDAMTQPWRTIDALVPGNVELDLMRAGVLADPSVGDRVLQLRPLETYAWCYRRKFAAPELAKGQRLELVFEGLDCVAGVWVNGKHIGAAANMLIAQRFDVTAQVRAGKDNEVFVRIESPILAARRHEIAPGEYAFMTNYESLWIRKAPHMYGWDIMPRVVSAGLWRGVHLDIIEPTHFRGVYFTTRSVSVEKQTAQVLLDWDFETDRIDVDGMRMRVTIGDASGPIYSHEHHVIGTHDRANIPLKGVKLWWPRGAGKAHLYDLRLELLDGEEGGGRREGGGKRVAGGGAPSANAEQATTVLAVYTASVGIRSVELERTDLTTPQGDGEFVFKINGTKIFAKGSNWVPLDALHSRDPQHVSPTIDMLTDLNCNMVRCWGGNVYEDHDFFDRCDREGIMVWQDFALACALYPQDPRFAREIEIEATSVVRKLRNHASLVLWAGNNEIDAFYSWGGLGVDPNTDMLSREVLPKVVRRYDPLRPYLPSSPYEAPAFHQQKRPAADVLPENHLWGPRNDFKGDTYAKAACHFASEIGYHGCPDRASLEQMMDPAFVWPWQDNPQWLIHATRPHPHMHSYDYRIELMARQIAVLFGSVPDNLDDFVFASQISQAEAFKFFIEWFRQGKWRKTGILWWNVRDGWPIISDAVVNYYGRKKLAYHYIKRVQSDVCVICAEPVAGLHKMVAVNDSLTPKRGNAIVRDMDTQRVLLESSFDIPGNDIVRFGELPQPAGAEMWDISWTLEGGGGGRNHYLTGARPFALGDYKRWMGKMGVR